MDIKNNWGLIIKHFNNSFKSSLSVSIAIVDTDSNPKVTPVGSLFLSRNLTGFYFEKYISSIPKSVNKKVCILGVNSNKWFWVQSLFKLKFNQHPAIRLYGELGNKRKATGIEITRLKRRMKLTKMLKGNEYLWGDMEYVREIKFTHAEKINIGKMTQHL